MVLYYIFVFVSFIYLFWKYKNSVLSLLIILCFYSGLANYYGKIIENPYKILLAVLSAYFLFRYKVLSGLKNNEKIFFIVFLLFSISFIFSGYINNDSFNMIFSQYGKYLPPVCIYFILSYSVKNYPEDLPYYIRLFFTLLVVQIILSFFKWGLIGIREWCVGSIAFAGGGVATPLPVLGFMLLWLDKRGQLTKKDWIFVVLLLMIAVVSLKRAIWFIMPFFVFMFLYYVPKKVNFKKLIYYIPIIPIIFYLGIRVNPTLNKEGKVWGSFDTEFAYNYVMQYSFGKTKTNQEGKAGYGRGGASLFIWDKFKNNQSLTIHDYLGYGLTPMYATDYAEFQTYNFGISDKGSATGVVQSYVTSGYIGILISIILVISIVSLIINPRIRFTMLLFILYDYLFYSGLVLRMSALLVLLFFIIIYSNYISNEELLEKYQTA
jgi:hypothetical protein